MINDNISAGSRVVKCSRDFARENTTNGIICGNVTGESRDGGNGSEKTGGKDWEQQESYRNDKTENDSSGNRSGGEPRGASGGNVLEI